MLKSDSTPHELNIGSGRATKAIDGLPHRPRLSLLCETAEARWWS
jgi:hypothetical protein